MDSLINAAARALAAGDPLGALNRVALRDDPPALALRGIALAQLGDLARARRLVQRAARAFGPREAVARARCVVAEAEIALAARDLAEPTAALDAARVVLEQHGDLANAAQARLVQARRLLLLGRLDLADSMLAPFEAAALPAPLQAVRALLQAGLCVRRLRTAPARRALARATEAAARAGIAALSAEVDAARRLLDSPAARLLTRGDARPLRLDEVEALQSSDALVVDALRHRIGRGATVVSLAGRPVLFALARALAESWPEESSREALLQRAFGARHADESHRARLRVEIGRLRARLTPLAALVATPRGFALRPRDGAEVAVLARPVEEAHGAVLALLADGEAWSSSALALALGASQRSVQRALEGLARAGTVQAFGHGRARRWLTPPLPGVTTTLLLPALP